MSAHRRLLPLLLLGLALTARADTPQHIFWEVKGKHNTVYLLGSIHLLKPADSALPEEAVQAYSTSKLLVMELDLNNLSPEELLEGNGELSQLPANQTLPGVLGPKLYDKLQTQLKANGLEPALVVHMQPWFVAMMLEQVELAKSGFEVDSGIDEQFAARAQADHKPIIGLEKIGEQLQIFAGLPLSEQRDYLRETLEKSDTDAEDTESIVRAWQHGDTAELERLLRENSKDSPALYRQLTVDRNRKWLPKLVELLGGDDDCLVIVGAMHLIGHDGVVDLLQQLGYAIRQR